MTIAFVLSGGGSLGAVQVGMLQALAESGIEPDLLIGTSAGAINCAWVATHGTSSASLAQLGELWTGLRRGYLFPVDPRLLARGLLGRNDAIASPSHLEKLISAHVPVDRLEDTELPVHMIAADLLSGRSVLLSTGSLVTSVMASAAIPGVFPPVQVDGAFLVDGVVAHDAGVGHAVDLGADLIYVLPSGTPCALPAPPRSAVGVAVHALFVLMQHRLADEMAALAGAAAIKVLPPLCPLAVSALDFSHAAELIERSHRASTEWIAKGDIDLPSPQRFLSAHKHHVAAGRRPRVASLP